MAHNFSYRRHVYLCVAVIAVAGVAFPLVSSAAAAGTLAPTVTLSVQYAPAGANSIYPTSTASTATVTVVVAGTSAGGTPTGTVTLHVPTSEIAPNGTLSECDAVPLGAGAEPDTATATCTLTIHDFCPFVASNPQAVRAGQQTEFMCCPNMATSSSPDPVYDGLQCAGSGNQQVDGTDRYILAYGPQSVTASYAGDANYASATSATSAVNVSPISCVDSMMESSAPPGCSNVSTSATDGLVGTATSNGAPVGDSPAGTPDQPFVPRPDPLQSGPDPAIVLLPPSGSGSDVYDVVVPSGAYVAEYLATISATGTVTCLDSCQETVFDGKDGEPAIPGGGSSVTVATIGSTQYYVLAASSGVPVTATASARCTQLAFAPVPATTTAAATPLAFTPDATDALCDYTLTSAGVPNGSAMDPTLVPTGNGQTGWYLVFSSQPTGNESLQAQSITFLAPTATDPAPAWTIKGASPLGVDNDHGAQVLLREGTDASATAIEYQVQNQPALAGVPWLADPGNDWHAIENPAMVQVDPAGTAPSPHCDVTDAKSGGTDECFMLTYSLGTYGPLMGPGGSINYCPNAGNWCSYPWNYNTLQTPCLYKAHSKTWTCSPAQTSLLIGAGGGLSFSAVSAVSSTEAAPTFATVEDGRTVIGAWAAWGFKDLSNVNRLVRQTFVGEYAATG